MEAVTSVVNSHPYAAAALAVGIPSLVIAKNAARNYLLRTFTVLLDLPEVSKPRGSSKIQGTAVVCGGSIAGLFTARLLADHYTKVLVIEPESFVFTPESWTLPLAPPTTRETTDSETGATITGLSHKRTRVWQYAAMHVYQILLVRFLRIVFPTFDQRAKEAGLLVAAADWKFWFGGMQGLVPSAQCHDRDHETLYGSRRAVETMLRALIVDTGLVSGLDGVQGNGTIQFVKGTVTAFNLSADKKAIVSVSYRAEDGKTVDVLSSLVSDCTGNTQAGLKHLSRALEQHSLADLRIEYNPKMYYETIEIPIPDDFNERVAALGLVDPVTKQPLDVKNTGFFMSWVPEPAIDYRTLLLGRLEGRMAFGLGGWDSALPTTWEEAVAYARGIQTPHKVPEWFFKILDILGADGRSEQITIQHTRFTCASRILYENKPDVVPTNFVAIGDSSMRLNPRLGEGVGKSAVGAITLDSVLRERLPTDPKFSQTFFTRLANRTSSLWDVSKWLDYGRKSTVPCKNESLAQGAEFRWFNQKMDIVMARNSYASEQFWRSLNFIAPTTDLLSPSILLHACKVAIFG